MEVVSKFVVSHRTIGGFAAAQKAGVAHGWRPYGLCGETGSVEDMMPAEVRADANQTAVIDRRA